MPVFEIDGYTAEKRETLAAHFMLLAYEECGTEFGMGFLQARNDITANNVLDFCAKRNDCSEVYADYLAGRMVKTTILFDGCNVKVSDRAPRPDYQGWCKGMYRTYDALLLAAAERAGIGLRPVAN